MAAMRSAVQARSPVGVLAGPDTGTKNTAMSSTGSRAKNYPDAIRAHAALLREQFRSDLEPLVAQYGHETVIAALDGLSDRPWPSVSLH
jgi:hypothetical protein